MQVPHIVDPRAATLHVEQRPIIEGGHAEPNSRARQPVALDPDRCRTNILLYERNTRIVGRPLMLAPAMSPCTPTTQLPRTGSCSQPDHRTSPPLESTLLLVAPLISTTATAAEG